jgi:hypothetical protein
VVAIFDEQLEMKSGPGFPTSYDVGFVFSELRWEVIVRFVDIDGIVDHHWHVVLIIYQYWCCFWD